MTESFRRPAAPPSPLLTAMELRAPFETMHGRLAAPLLKRAHRGDGHPVLVLPGFTAADGSTRFLRKILREQGYWVHGWKLGVNLGPTKKVVNGLAERLMAIHARHDEPISVIGWSLGGVYARELARLAPSMVRQVITLGSPFRMTEQDRSASSGFYDRLAPMHDADLDPRLPESLKPALDVPATAIYTKTDGVVRWFHCLEDEGPERENIEVRCSHCALGANPSVIHAIGDRLAQPADRWTPFVPPTIWRAAYPRPSSWQPDHHERIASRV